MLPIIYDIDIIVASLATNSKTPNINNDSEVSIDDINTVNNPVVNNNIVSGVVNSATNQTVPNVSVAPTTTTLNEQENLDKTQFFDVFSTN